MLEDDRQPVDIEKVREFFKDDRFATEACGAVIDEVGEGYAVCSFEIAPIHYNAAGGIMGGAIFTLADFALAIVSNVHETPAVSISNDIDFVAPAKGKRLIARAETDRSGTSVGFYTVIIRDELGTLVAKMSAVSSRRPKKA